MGSNTFAVCIYESETVMENFSFDEQSSSRSLLAENAISSLPSNVFNGLGVLTWLFVEDSFDSLVSRHVTRYLFPYYHHVVVVVVIVVVVIVVVVVVASCLIDQNRSVLSIAVVLTALSF